MAGGKGAAAFFERAKKAFGLGHVPNPFAEGAAADSLEDDVSTSVPAREAVSGAVAPEEIGAMFARQGAVGLWEDVIASPLLATVSCLERCAREGIDTSHAVYGSQLSKAVEALAKLIEPLSEAGEQDELVTRALLAMASVVSGKRARGRIVALAEAAKSPSVRGLAHALTRAGRP